MNKVEICNWLLTRKCNLECSYCAIVKDYHDKPMQYPDMSHYHKNEMSTDFVLETLTLLKKHNPNMFHIMYGGEPLLRKDLSIIINFCNENDIAYTIITNNSQQVQPMLQKLVQETEYIVGLTSSVDPLVERDSDTEKDRIMKSLTGMAGLNKLRGAVKDLVAEITVDNRNVPYLYDLVKSLSAMEINSDITFIDIAKTPYYDFSNVVDKSLLVCDSDELRSEMQKIIDDDSLDIHMKDTLLTATMDILPSELDCKMEDNISSIAIDADGSMRLCLRIRGTESPVFTSKEIFDSDGNIRKIFKEVIATDKRMYCKGCNHTCYLMSNLVSTGESDSDALIHSDKRKD